MPTHEDLDRALHRLEAAGPATPGARADAHLIATLVLLDEVRTLRLDLEALMVSDAGAGRDRHALRTVAWWHHRKSARGTHG